MAISWYSHPDGTYPYPYPPGTTGLESNLDLHISKTSGGAEFAHSTSSDNNYEIVDFEVPETTNYKARIQLQWLNPNTPEGDRYEYVGLAYSSTPIYQAEHSLGQELSSTATNAVVYVPIKLERFIKNSTNGVQTMPGISSYAVQVKLDTGKVTNNNPSIVLDVRNSTDFEITSSSNPGAIFTFAGAAKNPSSPPAAPTTVANLVVRLNGLARATDRLAVRFTSILNPNDVYQKPWFYRWYLRGDAEVNTGIVYDAADEVNSTDAYAIADYRVGNRPFESIDGVNAATPRQDGPGGDQVNMNDALFIQQYSTGLRDEWYIWIPKSGGSAAASSPGQATVSVGSAEAGKGTTVRVPVSVNVVNSSRGAGAYDFAISFDPRMLTVESVGAGDQPFGQPAAHRIDRAKGTVRLNGFLTTSRGLSGSSNVAYLTVKLVGGSGEKATLDVKSLALIDVLGNSIPVTERSGTLVIK